MNPRRRRISRLRRKARSFRAVLRINGVDYDMADAIFVDDDRREEAVDVANVPHGSRRIVVRTRIVIDGGHK